MTRKIIAPILLLIGVIIFISAGVVDECQQISAKQLREMMVQLGYTVKDIGTDPGKEKYSILITRDGLDIPVAAELSPSGKFLWLTVNLGPAKPDSAARSFSMLKQNAIIQPCQFYITNTTLIQMMGLPVENKGINNAWLRDRIESISGRVGETKAIWQ